MLLLHSSYRSSLTFLKGSQVRGGFGLLLVEPLMVGHWQFIVSKAINMCSLNLTSSIGDFSQASLPELPQRFVIPSVTSYRRWRYFCLGFLLSPFCHLLLRLQVVGRTHQARGFLNGKTTTATKPRSLVFSSG